MKHIITKERNEQRWYLVGWISPDGKEEAVRWEQDIHMAIRYATELEAKIVAAGLNSGYEFSEREDVAVVEPVDE